ncbi:MAG: HTTM domain-containing protein, partial [Byssovorax sp.]
MSPDATPAAEDAPPSPTFREVFRDAYFTFDRRTLGFTRLLLGFYLILDLFHRGRSWSALYSTDGVYPNNLNLSRTQGMFSLFDAFSSSGEVRVLWALMLVTFACLFVGYRTRTAQLLALFLVTGMNIRVPAIENGGYVVQNILLMWTCFLPLGDRFSIDALRASLRRRREATEDELNDRSEVLLPEQQAPLVTLLGPALLIQLAAIYFFNVIHKTGPAWKNGTAVHYVIYVDRMATPLIAQVRDHLPNWAILFMTRSALAIEGGLPLALLSPLGRTWSRRAAIVLMNALHLAFGLTFVLGPFSWALCVFSTLLFSADDWEIAARTMRREHRARAVVFDPESPGALFVCRVLKRLDHFELLTFRAGEPGPLGIAVEGRDGGLIGRSRAA